MIIKSYHDTYSKDEKGNMVLVSSVPYDMVVPPNWTQLKNALYNSVLFADIAEERISINQFGYSTFLKTITDGEAGNSDEKTLLKMFGLLKIDFTDEQKSQINKMLSDNYFEIQLT